MAWSTGLGLLIRLGVEWDYGSIVTESETLISEIQKKFMNALTDRSRAKVRAFMYQTLEKLSLEWESSEHVAKTSGEPTWCIF